MYHLCVFSGGIASLTRKQRRDRLAVLRAIQKDPRVSTWDMQEGKLYKTIYDLVADGLLVDLSAVEGYPWHRFRLSDKGRVAIEKAKQKP